MLVALDAEPGEKPDRAGLGPDTSTSLFARRRTKAAVTKFRIKNPANTNGGVFLKGRAPESRRALRPERLAVGSVSGLFERRHEIFLAFPFEFFLGGFEACDARRNFFPRTREAITLFGHCPSFLRRVFESRPTSIGDRNWGTNADAALQDCDCLRLATSAVDKTLTMLVAFTSSR